jgi:pimeloyl-ACP methyl ester carboxylesterase
MMKITRSLALAVLLGYIISAALMYVFQRDFLYFPTEEYEHPFERFGVSSQGETIEVIVLNRGEDKALLYFGGNGEAVVANAREFLSAFSDTTTTVYLVNYRGYGGSSGEPTESGIYADALAVYDQIKGVHSHISVAGRSLGSGVATYLAANRLVESVLLITPYDSILNVAQTKFPIFPVRLLLKDHYDSLSRAKNITSKVLVIAAEHDQVIPMSHTSRLIAEFGNGQVVLKVIENAGHNSLSNSANYYKTLRDFL